MNRTAALTICLGCALALMLPAPGLGATSIPGASLVVHPSDLPGFAGAKRKFRSATGASPYVKSVLGQRGREARKEIAKLKRQGFREGAQELLPTSNGEALSLALVFSSARVAKRVFKANLAEDLKAQGHAKLKRFTVAAVPGSSGFSATETGVPGAAANVLFATGRCFFLVGDSLRSGSGENAETAPIAGATALYPRVKSLCA